MLSPGMGVTEKNETGHVNDQAFTFSEDVTRGGYAKKGVSFILP